jgi:DNA-binding cell septation regulator SpoVG
MARKTALIAAFFLLGFSASGFAGGISVTGIKTIRNLREKIYQITINDAIVINDVRLLEARGKKFLKFPEYVSRRKRVYPQVVFTTREANEAVRNAVINSAAEPARHYNMEYKITGFSKFSKKSNMKILATVSFNDALEIECKIIEGKNGPWVSWPSKKLEKNKTWFRQIVITDKKLKEAVENDLLSRYEAMAAKEGE